MHSHGGDEKTKSPFHFCALIVLVAVIIFSTAILTLVLGSCTTTERFFQKRLIEREEPAYSDYVLFIRVEKRADCTAPHFVVTGELRDDKPIKTISAERITRSLKDPDKTALMSGHEFHLISPKLESGQTERFELKIRRADTGEQVLIARMEESLNECPTDK